MEKKQLDINNMNGMTEEEDKTCGLNDMNCVADEEDKTCGLNDMNCVADEEGNAKQRLPEGVPALCGNIRGCIGSLWRGTLQAVMELYHNNIRGFAI